MHACQSRQAGEEAVRALLALGADRSLATPQGQRAVDLAAATGRWPIVALLDPAYPMPSAFDAAPTLSENQPSHLLDALRFGHWNVVAGFSGIVREWSPTSLAELYLDLAADGEASGAARAWLLNHGLDGAAKVDGETTLFDELIARLPESALASRDLVARGAPIGGAGLLARVLEAATDVHVEVVRAFAHELFARGADTFGTTASAPSALHPAIALGDEALVEALLERGCDPNCRTRATRRCIWRLRASPTRSCVVSSRPAPTPVSPMPAAKPRSVPRSRAAARYRAGSRGRIGHCRCARCAHPICPTPPRAAMRMRSRACLNSASRSTAKMRRAQPH
jgi:hypothetical protein